ncbi:MAG: phosphotransferase [Gammaproteobacteria bacterium]|nr:phosphotransferase [Gammaproteobacteria bacterium]
MKNLFALVCSTYQLGNLTSIPSLMSGNDINTNYKVTTTKGNFLLKIIDIENYKKNHFVDKQALILSLTVGEQVAESMFKNNIPAVPALPHGNNEKMLMIDQKIIFVYPFVEGRISSLENITQDKIKKVANLLAKIHSLKISSEMGRIKWNMTIASLSDLVTQKPWLQLKDIQIFNQMLNELESFIQINSKQAIHAIKHSDDLVLAHNEMIPQNILWNLRDEPIIVDWESGGYMPVAVNYVDTLLAWCLESKENKYVLNTRKADGFIKEYERVQPKIKLTDNAISIVTAKWLLWLAFCSNRIAQPENQEVYIEFIFDTLKVLNFIQYHAHELEDLHHVHYAT